HVGNARVRIEAALLALFVCHRVVADDAVASTNGTQRAKTSAPAERPAVDAQTLLAVLVDEESRRPVTEARIDVLLPQIQGLQDVAVGIDDVVGATQNPHPFGQAPQPAIQTLVWCPGTLGRCAGAATQHCEAGPVTGRDGHGSSPAPANSR